MLSPATIATDPPTLLSPEAPARRTMRPPDPTLESPAEMPTAPPSLSEAPACTITEPDDAPAPENKDTLPDDPLMEFPVPIAIRPLSEVPDNDDVDPVKSEAFPDEKSESAVDTLTAPERKTEFTPDVILMLPPEFFSEELSPATRVMLPPGPVTDVPAISEMLPDLLSNPFEWPVDKRIEPLGPSAPAPVEI